MNPDHNRWQFPLGRGEIRIGRGVIESVRVVAVAGGKLDSPRHGEVRRKLGSCRRRRLQHFSGERFKIELGEGREMRRRASPENGFASRGADIGDVLVRQRNRGQLSMPCIHETEFPSAFRRVCGNDAI